MKSWIFNSLKPMFQYSWIIHEFIVIWIAYNCSIVHNIIIAQNNAYPFILYCRVSFNSRTVQEEFCVREITASVDWQRSTRFVISREIARYDHPAAVIRPNSAADQRFWLSGRNRSDPPHTARNRIHNGIGLRGDVPFANLLIPTRKITAGRVETNEFSRSCSRL